MPLSGKVALVTGASRAIGKAICLDLAGRGANVALQYFRNGRGAKQTQAEVENLGRKALAVRTHFGKTEDVEDLFEQVHVELGGLDILVFCTASAVFRPILEVDDKSWDWTMNVSARSALACVRKAVPLMEARGGGRIVLISSIGSQRTLPFYGMAGTAKAALEGLTRYLAVELAPKRIIVNAIAPGVVYSSDSDERQPWDLYPDKTFLEKVLRRTPLGRFTTPIDVAAAVSFLVSQDAEAIVGQTLVVDGGQGLDIA